MTVYFVTRVPLETESKKHYVLVHGCCHGAWCWYKLKPRLESIGHRVSVVDLAASGIHPAKIEDLHSPSDYSEPLRKLLAALPAGDEKVVLVGHSHCGLNIALAAAANIFPHKISLTVFLTDTIHRPSYVLEQFLEKIPSDAWLDTEFCDCGRLKTLHVVRSKGLIVPSLSTMFQRATNKGRKRREN